MHYVCEYFLWKPRSLLYLETNQHCFHGNKTWNSSYTTTDDREMMLTTRTEPNGVYIGRLNNHPALLPIVSDPLLFDVTRLHLYSILGYPGTTQSLHRSIVWSHAGFMSLSFNSTKTETWMPSYIRKQSIIYQKFPHGRRNGRFKESVKDSKLPGPGRMTFQIFYEYILTGQFSELGEVLSFKIWLL